MMEDLYKYERELNSRGIEIIGGVDEATPMTFPFDVSIDYLRDDVPEEPLKAEDVLKNAGNVKDGQIKLPKVVG